MLVASQVLCHLIPMTNFVLMSGSTLIYRGHLDSGSNQLPQHVSLVDFLK